MDDCVERILDRDSLAAWWDEYYAPDRPQFKQCQEDAQKNKRGLWAEEDPVAPWDWRRR